VKQFVIANSHRPTRRYTTVELRRVGRRELTIRGRQCEDDAVRVATCNHVCVAAHTRVSVRRAVKPHAVKFPGLEKSPNRVAGKMTAVSDGLTDGRRCRQAIGRRRELDATMQLSRMPGWPSSNDPSNRRSLKPAGNMVVLAGHYVHTGQLVSPAGSAPVCTPIYTNATHVVQSLSLVHCRDDRS